MLGRVVAGETVCNGMGIFAVYRATIFAIDNFNTFVVASLDALDKVGAIHYIGFEENDGALVKSCGEKVACPKVSVAVEWSRVGVIGTIGVWGKIGVVLEGLSEAGGEGDFFLDGAGKEALQHFEAFIVVGDFAFVEGSGKNDVEVLTGDGDG